MTVQGLIVMAIAALAAGFLTWRLIAPFVRGSASSGCHGCSAPCELRTPAKRTPCDESTVPPPPSVVKSPITQPGAASGAEKADANAAVVNELVTQRRTMRDGMMKMEGGMMGHMMEHVQAGKDSMAMCPMMKQMGGMKH